MTIKGVLEVTRYEPKWFCGATSLSDICYYQSEGDDL
jgi:hypothetical protein